MGKYLNRFAARNGLESLRESAKEGKKWIVSKKLVLEAEDENIEFEKGEEIEVGNKDGDLALSGGQAACVVISDPELAQKIADVVVSADELSDVKFVEKPALDAVMGGEEVDDVIDTLADEEGDNVEVAELDVEKKESVEDKYAKFSKNVMNPEKFVTCESILVDESDEAPLNMRTMKADRIMRESLIDYSKFASRVSELNGSIQPGDREVALSESGKVIGAYNKAANSGILFLENEFDSVEAMDSFDTAPESLVKEADDELAGGEDLDFDAWLANKSPAEVLDADEAEGVDPRWAAADVYDMTGDPYYNQFIARGEDAANAFGGMDKPVSYEELRAHLNEPAAVAAESCSVKECVERALCSYETSAKTGADYARLSRVLNMVGLKESVIGKIVSTFDNKSLKECVRVYDSKYGKYVAAFNESASCDNFIVETGDAKRFTKRFFG